MPLAKILSELDAPVDAKIKEQIVDYMKNLPAEHSALALQCAQYLDRTNTLAAVLAVVHALNEGEFLLKCRDDDVLANDLSREFDLLLNDDAKKSQPAALTSARAP